MNILNWFKKEKPKKLEQKEFTFNVLKTVKIGDLYEYTVVAETKDEAFIKLVEYFFGENCNQDVKQKSFQVTYPNQSTFRTNMPYWFAKKISGYVKDDKNDYQKELKKFAIENNINLKLDI